MNLRMDFDGAEYLTLEAVDKGQKAVADKGWGMTVDLNAAGEVIYFDEVSMGGQWEKTLGLALEDVEADPPKGTYSLKALGAVEVSFTDLLKAVQNYILTDGTPITA